MHPEPNGTQDPLRVALERLASTAESAEAAFRLYNRGGEWMATDCAFAQLSAQIKAAREALAAEPPEGEWEYRAMTGLGQRGGACGTVGGAQKTGRKCGRGFWIERRRKAGAWQRVDDRSDLDLLADALSTPGQQEEGT